MSAKEKVLIGEVVEIPEETAAAVFDGKVNLADVLNDISLAAREEAGRVDASTENGRKDLKSVAYRVARSKTLLDGAGKSIVDGWKKQSKVVDSERKKARDFLDSLKVDVLLPVTEWEDEQQRIADEEQQRKEREEEKRFADIERREAELARKEQEQRDKEDAKRREQEQKERDERLQRESAERAKREAEEAAHREMEESERREREANERAERAEREAAESVERERARVKAQEEAEAAEAKKREADKHHHASVNNAAVDALVVSADINNASAKKVITAIAKGCIPNVSIRY